MKVQLLRVALFIVASTGACLLGDLRVSAIAQVPGVSPAAPSSSTGAAPRTPPAAPAAPPAASASPNATPGGAAPQAGQPPLPAAQPAPSAGGDAPAVPMPDVEPAPTTPSMALPSALPPADTTAKPGVAPVDERAQSRQVTFTLRELGAQAPLTLRGASDLSGVKFGIRQDEVVTTARLKISGAMSPSLLPQYSNVTVTLNEQYVATIPVNKDNPRFSNVEMAIDPVLFTSDNRLNFRLAGQYSEKCNDPLSGLIWATISDTSALTLTLVRLPPQRDLASLPAPFFDPHDPQRFVLPFVVADPSPDDVLQASGIVASWFGELAKFRSASFPVTTTIPASGNAVVLAKADALPADLGSVKIAGPTIAILPNQNDASSSILLVAGRDSKELLIAAKALVLGSRVLGGQVATVDAPVVSTRKPYDAPAWIPTDRPVAFGQLVPASELQASGYAPGPLRVPFKTAPDLYTWRGRGFPAEIHYRGPPGPIVDLTVSRLDVGINDLYLTTMPLAEPPLRLPAWLPTALQNKDVRQLLSSGSGATVRQMSVPPYDVFGENELQFTFDARPLDRGACTGVPGALRMSVDPDSTIDLSRGYRIATLPNLAFFINSGFPFSRMADLSETAVILPHEAGLHEVEVYLELVGRIGSLTGYPATGMIVVRPDNMRSVSSRDLLLVGTFDHLQGAAALLNAGPLQLDGADVRVSEGSRLGDMRRLFPAFGDDPADRVRNVVQAQPARTLSAIVGFESPLSSQRSLVAVVAGSQDALQATQSVLRDPALASKVDGDISILTDGRPASYRIGPTYTVGSLPLWLYPSFELRDSPVRLLAFLLIGAGLLALVTYRALRRRATKRLRQIEPESRS